MSDALNEANRGLIAEFFGQVFEEYTRRKDGGKGTSFAVPSSLSRLLPQPYATGGDIEKILAGDHLAWAQLLIYLHNSNLRDLTKKFGAIAPFGLGFLVDSFGRVHLLTTAPIAAEVTNIGFSFGGATSYVVTFPVPKNVTIILASSTDH